MDSVVTTVTAPIKIWLEYLYAAFKDENIAIFASALLLAAAVLVYFFFVLYRMLPYYRALRRVTKVVRAQPDASAFFNEFSSIDETIRTDRQLGHAWGEFEETLIRPEGDEPKVIRNTARPAAYLNVNAAIESGLPLHGYQAVPNYFVGVGLLFTFFGLVAALHYAAEGVNSADVKLAQDALQQLLKVASFKFLTSISGILSSLGLSYLIKREVHQLQVAFEMLCKALEQRMQFVTPESVALANLREQKAQTQQLQRFNTDFAIQLADAIEKKLNSSLGSAISGALDPLTKRLEGMSTSIGTANEDALKKMLTEFSGSLNQSAGKEIEVLAGELRKIQETLSQTSTGVTHSGAQFGQRLESAASKLESMLGESASTMRNGLGEAISRMQTMMADAAEAMKRNALQASAGTGLAMDKAGGALAGHIGIAAAQLEASLAPAVKALSGMEPLLHQLSGRMQGQTAEFNSSIDSMRDLVRQMDQSANRLKDAALPVATTAEQLGKAANQTETASRMLTDTHQRIATLVANLDASIANNKKIWEEYRARFEGVDASLSNTVKEMLAGAERFHGEVARFMTELDKHLGSSLNSLASGVVMLNDAAEQLDETVGKFVQATTR